MPLVYLDALFVGALVTAGLILRVKPDLSQEVIDSTRVFSVTGYIVLCT